MEVAKEAGIEVNRGIVVNDYMETSIPDVYAVGECAEHRGTVYGLVAPHRDQGTVLAKHLCGVETQAYTGSILSTKLKVSEVDVFSAGAFRDTEDTRALRVQDEWNGIYKKMVLQDDQVVGGVLFGDTSDAAFMQKLIKEKSPMTEEIYQKWTGHGGSGSSSGVEQLTAEDQVCDCNGVTKGTILATMQEKGLTSFNEVKRHTKAGGSCGGCKPLVEQIIQGEMGDNYDPDAESHTPICDCTELSRDEVVEAIRSKHLTMVRETMNVLDWKNDEGCPKCRPALNYYLGMVWPKEHEDERVSRVVNEQRNANIQNDGTYSVIPRMYGGVTSPEELRKIAEVAEKYNVRMVKMTGGQRINLLGVQKSDLPKIWEELGMPSGHAYAKALRTVKTCVGSDFCRFGTQDSIQLGIDMEKAYEGLSTPHKVKMSVSACPRNCAESGIKDVGVVGVEGGWELYVGGNAGVNLRGGDLLCKVDTEAEVLEVTSAFLQFYRETAAYWERTSMWIENIGLEKVKAAVVEDLENRKRLVNRLEEALEKREEPWGKDVNDAKTRTTWYKEPELETTTKQ
ncbi:nitrite reductase (NADH) large subunit [Marininema mesophilum]|uniref:Nitrite reductase (NADH) large subunit n=1 Tax=Marininema mesophilum TaxID=1048340 RepID=A0A1H2S069_9BACL|nr:nitrite reductase (NADH) large subunit [Marininema mesophilum]